AATSVPDGRVRLLQARREPDANRSLADLSVRRRRRIGHLRGQAAWPCSGALRRRLDEPGVRRLVEVGGMGGGKRTQEAPGRRGGRLLLPSQACAGTRRGT